jgi:hypothetical protein
MPEATQLELFNPTKHEHDYRLTQGPHEVQPEITPSDNTRWCWTCCSWVTVHEDGRTDTWRERAALRGKLVRAIKAGRVLKREAIKEYREEFQTSYGTALWEIEWAIGYYNEHGWV